jgi:hypothetical protein
MQDAVSGSLGDPLVFGSRVSMQSLYPLVVRLPATADLTNVSLTYRSVDLQLNGVANASAASGGSDTLLWWTVSINVTDPYYVMTSPNRGLAFNTVSDKCV